MAAPRIAGSRLVQHEGQVPGALQNAQRSWQTRRGALLLIWDREGRMGVGEASPLPGFSGEDLSDCLQALDGIHERVEGSDAQGWPQVAGLEALPAARFAWECAVADLWSRAQGVSVAELLGGKRSHDAVALNALVLSLDEASAALNRGISTLKLKVGLRDFDAELALLRGIRAELGPDFMLRLDCNGSWSIDTARRNLERLRPLKPEFFEQPVAPGELVQLGACAVPWAADESLRSSEEAAALLHAEGCAAWVLKPALLGLRRARLLAVAAQQAGLQVVITHLFDGPVGLAAACELALSLPSAPAACGLDRHAGLAVWPEVALPHRQGVPGVLSAHRKPGLGFEKEGLPWS